MAFRARNRGTSPALNEQRSINHRADAKVSGDHAARAQELDVSNLNPGSIPNEHAVAGEAILARAVHAVVLEDRGLAYPDIRQRLLECEALDRRRSTTVQIHVPRIQPIDLEHFLLRPDDAQIAPRSEQRDRLVHPRDRHPGESIDRAGVLPERVVTPRPHENRIPIRRSIDRILNDREVAGAVLLYSPRAGMGQRRRPSARSAGSSRCASSAPANGVCSASDSSGSERGGG